MTDSSNFSSFGISTYDILLINDQLADILIWFIAGILSQIVNIFGVVTSVINIMCFVKMGFKEPINVSLLGLSISDLGSLLTLIWINTSLIPDFRTACLSFDVLGVAYLTSTLPHFAFTRVSSWITAMITLERCLCIILPLQVKRIITSKRVFVLVICVFIISMACGAPVYAVNKLGKTFYPFLNKTLLGIISTEDREKVEQIYFTVNNFVLPFIAFAIIIICTLILIISLRMRIKWHKGHSVSSNKYISSRHEKVAKMVLMISTLFISCFVPFTIIMLAVAFEPDLNITGKYVTVSLLMASVGFLLESVNSSTNIIIYYHMSRKYRFSFQAIIGKGVF